MGIALANAARAAQKRRIVEGWVVGADGFEPPTYAL
jgi:hypothetical protein